MKLLLSLLLLASASLHAAPAIFWDFNNANLAPTYGSATTIATYTGAGIGTIAYTPGTTENAPSGIIAGTSLGWIDLVETFSDATFQATNLNLSAENDVVLTFALRTDHFFQIGDSLSVYTNAGSGWVLQSTLAAPSITGWQIYEVQLPNLDNVSSGGFRIVSETTVSAGKFLSIDNVSIIPEPSTTGLAILAGLGAVILLRRRRRSPKP